MSQADTLEAVKTELQVAFEASRQRSYEMVAYRNILRGLTDGVELALASLPPDARTVLRAALAGREHQARLLLGD